METLLTDNSRIVRRPKYKICIGLVLFVNIILLTGCNSALNTRVYQPLVNAEVVTIEVVNVNHQKCPGNSLQAAVSKFDEYVLGDVRIIHANSIEIAPGKNGALSQSQFNKIISQRPRTGQSVINLVIARDYKYSDNKGRYSWQKNKHKTRNVISINAKNCNKTARWIPLVSKEEVWKTVILHELCHSLNVPADKSHKKGEHCTNPGCVLYPKIDIFSAMAWMANSSPPKGLCKQCRAEIKEAHLSAKGKFYDDTREFNRFGGLTELNPGNLDAVAKDAFYEFVCGNYETAVKKFDILIAKKPKYKFAEVNNGTSAFALRGFCRHNLKQYEQAVEDYKNALEIIPGDLPVLKTYAKILCTSGDQQLRDGKLAVSLARKACELEGWDNPASLDILACAYAETGDFTSAVEYEQQAVALQESPDKKHLKHLKLFKKEIPYHR